MKRPNYKWIIMTQYHFRNDLIYLASPYSDDSNIIMINRFDHIARIAGCLTRELIRYNTIVYSPICHNVPMENVDPELESNYNYWQKIDELYINRSTCFMIANINKWNKSIGVKKETEYAKDLNKRIFHCKPRKLQNNYYLLISEEIY